MTSAREDFRKALEALDYQRWTRFRPFANRDIWYRRSESKGGMYHVAYLAHQPRAKAYGLQLGFFSDDELSILERCQPVISEQMHPNESPVSFSTFLLWMLFTLGNATDPELLSIPDPLDRYTWQSQLEALRRNYLEPYFWPVKSARQAKELLLTGRAPFGWSIGDPILRAAQCLALAASDGTIDSRLYTRLIECRDLVPAASSAYRTWEKTIEIMFAEFRKLH
jgi:hypothetical protein